MQKPKVKAAVFLTSKSALEVRQYPLADPIPGMAAVELEASGICGTDVHIWDGAIGFKGPIILGHEFIGRVLWLGDGPGVDCLNEPLVPGDRVAVNVIEPCGECLLCREGGSASCLRLAKSLTYTASSDTPPHLHGGYAEATICPARYLHKMPEALPTEVAAAFLCAGPTVVRGVQYAGGVREGDNVIVQGAGPVGLFAALYARKQGAAAVTVIASGSNSLRLELARLLSGGSVLDIRATTPEYRREHVLQTTDGLGADLIIEGTGNPSAIPEGLGLLRPRGRYIWAGQYSDRGSIAVPTHLVTLNALQVFGSAQFTVEDRSAYFRFLESAPESWPTIRRVITHRFPLDLANQALETVRGGQAVKALFVKG